MVFIPTHKRGSIGKSIHETLVMKKKRLKHEEEINKVDSSLNLIRKEIEKEKVESEYLNPEIKNWVETEAIKELKERVKKWLFLKYPIHIIGPTGCGKTLLSLQIAKEFGRPVVWINGDESVTTTDLIGGYSQIETTSIRDKYIHNVYKDKDILKADWVDNPLTLACKYGYTLIYNEFSRSKPAANNVLLSIFSEGILELPTQFGGERYVKVHPDFRAIFTSNPIEYAGIHRPQDALLDRMISIFMDHYDKETEKKIIMAQSKIKEKDAKMIVELIRKLRAKLPETEEIGLRPGIMLAQALEQSKNIDETTIKQLLPDILNSKIRYMKDSNKKWKL